MHIFKMYYLFADQQWIRFGFKRQPVSFDDAWKQVQEDFLDLFRITEEVRRERMKLPPSPLWRIGIEQLDEAGKQVANQVRNITIISAEDSIRERREKLGADADLAEFFEAEIIEAFAREHGIEPDSRIRLTHLFFLDRDYSGFDRKTTRQSVRARWTPREPLASKRAQRRRKTPAKAGFLSTQSPLPLCQSLSACFSDNIFLPYNSYSLMQLENGGFELRGVA
jgi:hypothetical protein